MLLDRRCLSLIAATLLPTTASADPQVSASVTVGGGVGDLRSPSVAGVFHLGLRGELLLFRTRDGQFDLGPYVEVLTRNFETFETGGGASFLLPISEVVPLIVSVGPFVRGARSGWDGGVAAQAFVGARSFNFHSVYGFALGGFVQTRVGLGPAQQLDVVGGLQVDLEILSLPFLLVWQAFR